MRFGSMVVCLILLVILAADQGWAQPQFTVGVRASYLAFIREGAQVDGFQIRLAPTMVYGVVGSYRLNPRLSLEFTLERYADADGDVDSVPVNAGSDNVSNIAQAYATLSVKYRWLTRSRFNSYLGTGMAYYLNDFTPEDYFNTVFSRMELENSWGFQVLAGADYWITPAWGLNLDLRYQWTEPDLKWQRRSDGVEGSSKFTFAGAMTTIGIKYLF